jgi:hypothetical protein
MAGVFITSEQEVLNRVGTEGRLQAEFTNTQLGIIQRLMIYPSSGAKPKLKSIFTSQGTRIVPYKYGR